MKRELIAQKNPKSPISEIFRTLRTNIQFMSNSRRMQALLVTSTFPGEGKSWITSNLAVTFAQAGKRVILVDADMRKGRQYSIFGVSPKPGLSNLLAEIDEDYNIEEQILDYVQQTDVENLYVITAGNIPPNPSELLVSSQMSTVLNGLKEICDIVIVDGTPCELVTDAVILARMVDATIIVTAHKQTKKDALQRVIKNIKNVGGRIAGVVINKVPISSKKYGERYYYYGDEESTTDTKNKENEKKEDNTKKTNFEEVKKERTKPSPSEQIPKAMKKSYSESTLSNRSKQNNDSTETNSNDILKQINEYLEKEKKDL